MSPVGPGRPRLRPPRREGATAREQILDAAAELFTTRGYAMTSTRAVAESVGVRQASLYHHFATKDDVLEALLVSTVGPTLTVAEALVHLPVPAVEDDAARLHALCLFDGRQLCGTRWNLGVLYLLPELRTERFARFQEVREELRGSYHAVGAALVARTGGSAGAGELAFRLVESLISARADGKDTRTGPEDVAGACLRLGGWTGPVAPVAARGEELLRAVLANA